MHHIILTAALNAHQVAGHAWTAQDQKNLQVTTEEAGIFAVAVGMLVALAGGLRSRKPAPAR